MGLKYAADYRTLLWTLVFTPSLVVAQYLRPDWVPWLSWLSFYFAIACGVIAHNHLHLSTFKSKWQSELFGDWISIFYGYPTFAWIPTHNLNHHRWLNKAGDATITWRFTNRHTSFVALTYFFVSAYYQSAPIKNFVRRAKETNPRLYRQIIRQHCIVWGAHALLLSTAIVLHGFKTGLFVWAMSLGLPAMFALWTLMFFNYEQHVHADAWSPTNHSRNFVGKALNFLLFNNGLHTSHHENARMHWSQLPKAHAQFEAAIDDRLKEPSLFWYLIKQYVLAPFLPRLGTQQLGADPSRRTRELEEAEARNAPPPAGELSTS